MTPIAVWFDDVGTGIPLGYRRFVHEPGCHKVIFYAPPVPADGKNIRGEEFFFSDEAFYWHNYDPVIAKYFDIPNKCPFCDGHLWVETKDTMTLNCEQA